MNVMLGAVDRVQHGVDRLSTAVEQVDSMTGLETKDLTGCEFRGSEFARKSPWPSHGLQLIGLGGTHGM